MRNLYRHSMSAFFRITLCFMICLLAFSGSQGHGEWCAEHEIFEKECPWCKPSLIKSMGFCKEHSVPEALCFQCNPKLIPGFRFEKDWCKEHEKPESQCSSCQNEDSHQHVLPVTESDKDTLESTHTDTESENFCPTAFFRINFPKESIVSKIGIETVSVSSQKVPFEIKCNAEIHYNKNRFARLAPRASGVVTEMTKDLGETVEKGDTIVSVDSPGLGAAKSEYLQACALMDLWDKNLSLEKNLAEKGVATERDILEAKTRFKEAEVSLIRATQALFSLGLGEADLEMMRKNPATSSLLSIRSPFKALIVEKNAVMGEVVNPSQSVVSVADMSEMWAMLDVYEKDLPRIRTGLPVLVRVDGVLGKVFKGNITWISPEVNASSRTVKIRVPLSNPFNHLRAGLFGEAIIQIMDQPEYIMIPKSSLQWEGCCLIVFVKKSPLLFLPKKIEIAFETDSGYAISKGLLSGDEIVTTGSFLLKTELLKENIGAGCCEVHPGAE